MAFVYRSQWLAGKQKMMFCLVLVAAADAGHDVLVFIEVIADQAGAVIIADIDIRLFVIVISFASSLVTALGSSFVFDLVDFGFRFILDDTGVWCCFGTFSCRLGGGTSPAASDQ